MPTGKDDLSKVIAEQAVQGEKINNIEKSCETIRECLLGNGKPGLVVRTDRLEQRAKLQSRIFWLMFGTTFAIAAKAIAEMLGYSVP